jgi:sugar transferase (PEP-CTERM/EpsH1 system associated)
VKVNPRRVALVTSRLQSGGKERCVVNLADGLFERGWAPVVICLEKAPVDCAIRHPEIQVVTLEKWSGHDWRVPFRLASLFRRERVAIAHSHNWGTQLEVALAGRMSGVPALVHTQHGLDYGTGETRHEGRGRLRRSLKRISAGAFSAVAAVSAEVRDQVRREWRVPESRLFLVHNGIHVTPSLPDTPAREAERRALGLGASDVAIGTVGIFRPVKNFSLLIGAFAMISKAHPEAVLLMVGDGPLRAGLEEEARRSGAGERIRFLGLRSDVPRVLPCLDIYTLPSISEGLSISILEAMAASLPIVATRVGGNSEAVEEGSTGLLVPSRSREALAASLESLIVDSERRRRMGSAGRRRALERFTVDRMISGYEEVYAAVQAV